MFDNMAVRPAVQWSSGHLSVAEEENVESRRDNYDLQTRREREGYTDLEGMREDCSCIHCSCFSASSHHFSRILRQFLTSFPPYRTVPTKIVIKYETS